MALSCCRVGCDREDAAADGAEGVLASDGVEHSGSDETGGCLCVYHEIGKLLTVDGSGERKAHLLICK